MSESVTSDRRVTEVDWYTR